MKTSLIYTLCFAFLLLTGCGMSNQEMVEKAAICKSIGLGYEVSRSQSGSEWIFCNNERTETIVEESQFKRCPDMLLELDHHVACDNLVVQCEFTDREKGLIACVPSTKMLEKYPRFPAQQ